MFDVGRSKNALLCHYGVGLGLATIYGIMERHNGTVNVECPPGKRTTFTLELPV